MIELAARAKPSVWTCVPLVSLIVLALAVPARADDLADVALLDARLTAAGELEEPTPEPDWGASDLSSPAPAGEQGAPAVPVEVQPAPEERYYPEEPQYHREYQVTNPGADQLSPDQSVTDAPEPSMPAVEAPTVEAETPGPVEETEQTAPSMPSTPDAQAAAGSPEPLPQPEPVAAPQASSAPVVFIWVWNWTWNWTSDPRYQNSDQQYQKGGSISSQDVQSILDEIGVQMPVEVGLGTGGDITSGIEQILPIPVQSQVPAAPAASDQVVSPQAESFVPAPPDRVRPGAGQKRRRAAPRRPAASADVGAAPLFLATSTRAELVAARVTQTRERARESHTRPRAKSPLGPKRPLPLPSERVASSSAAGGTAASIFFKTFAVLIGSLLLAGLGPGRRLRLPSTRWRGLLGSRTDPPG